MAEKHCRSELSRSRTKVVPTSVAVLDGTWIVPSGFSPSRTTEVSTPIAGTTSRVGEATPDDTETSDRLTGSPAVVAPLWTERGTTIADDAGAGSRRSLLGGVEPKSPKPNTTNWIARTLAQPSVVTELHFRRRVNRFANTRWCRPIGTSFDQLGVNVPST